MNIIYKMFDTKHLKRDIKHRDGVKKYFITFPKSNVTKQSFADKFSTKFLEQKYICVEEQHKDGTPHLHLAIELKEGYPKLRLLDYFREVYPNDYKRIDIQSMRSWKESFRYLTCPDKDKIVDFTPYLKNCELGFQFSQKHRMIINEYGEKLESYEICLCDYCIKCIQEDIKSHYSKSSDVRETFGDGKNVMTLREF